ncbi:t-SNARE [Rozella allomycis CSF55]|uniref:t-SNARE n=1 Tax=Rozella allomycis (strain CSF55) TaxID=988480 RepID=A0A4V1IZY9_ROZAC|nr:t-SNARE [Rozella allomycis CSF55]
MRNRFEELQKFESEPLPAKEKKKLTDVEKAIPDEDPKMNSFFEEINNLRNNVSIIKRNVDLMNEMQSNALIAMSDEQESEIRESVERIMTENTKIANDTRTRLKAIEEVNQKLEKEDPSNSDLRIRKSQHSSTAKKLLNVMNDYQQIQIQFKDKFKAKLQRQYLIERVTSGENTNIFSGNLLSSSAEARKMLETIQERHQDIIRIEQGIMELHQLFVDLSVLVENQGDMINQIDHHVAQSVAYTTEGVEHMRKATRLQKRSRRSFYPILIPLVSTMYVITVAIVFCVNLVGASLTGANQHEFIEKINELRVSKGLQPVCYNDKLTKAAFRQASYQHKIHKMTHSGAHNSDLSDRVSSVELSYSSIFENVAMNTEGTVSRIFDQWYNSRGHYLNMIQPKVNIIGLANVGSYWTLDLANSNEGCSMPSNYTNSQSHRVQKEDNHSEGENVLSTKLVLKNDADEISSDHLRNEPEPEEENNWEAKLDSGHKETSSNHLVNEPETDDDNNLGTKLVPGHNSGPDRLGLSQNSSIFIGPTINNFMHCTFISILVFYNM